MSHPTALPLYQDNYIWLLPSGASNVIIIDPGDERPVIDYLKQTGLTPVAIFTTHQCYDHVDGIRPLLKHYSIPVYGPATERIPAMSHPVKQDDLITIDGCHPFQVIDVPGHTAGHIAYYQTGSPGRLFCGDTLFAGGCGRLHSGLYDEMFNSLQRLAALPDETLIYCAHEYTEANLRFALHLDPDNNELQKRMTQTTALRTQGKITLPSTLAVEKNTNPFLRCHTAPIIKAAQHYAAQTRQPSGSDAATVFRLIRHWKNNF